MPNQIQIYGASDDCIEIEGAIREEFNGDKGFIEISTGDVFSIEYTAKGVWKVFHCHKEKGSTVKISKEPHGTGEDPEPYTDTMTVTGEIEWARFCTKWPMDDDAKAEMVEEWFNQNRVDDLPKEAIDAVFEAVSKAFA